RRRLSIDALDGSLAQSTDQHVRHRDHLHRDDIAISLAESSAARSAPPHGSPRQYPSAKDRTGPDYQARPRRSMSPSGHSSSGKDRLLIRIDGQVDRPRTRCDDRGSTGLPDAGKTGNYDEMPGHATCSGVIAATVSLSARRSNRSA